MAESDAPLALGGQTVTPASRRVVTIPVSTVLSGTSIGLTLLVVNGAEPGPVLTVLNTVHGGEVPARAVPAALGPPPARPDARRRRARPRRQPGGVRPRRAQRA